MSQKETLKLHNHTKVLVPANSYEFSADTRLLIPFTSGEKIGFINNKGEIIVTPQYNMYYGECYNENDYIKVTQLYHYGFSRADGSVVTYSRPLYGLINHLGETIIEPECFSIVPSKWCNETVYTIQRKDYKYGVININGEEIIPFGKYQWIDGFDHGLVRVRIGKETNAKKMTTNLWGIVNDKGVEVLPLEYSEIWNFYDKNRLSTKVVKNGIEKKVYLHELNQDIVQQDELIQNELTSNINGWEDDYGTHYGEYAGSYVQDVMGFSDDVINDAFEGDPDAYWNID